MGSLNWGSLKQAALAQPPIWGSGHIALFIRQSGGTATAQGVNINNLLVIHYAELSGQR